MRQYLEGVFDGQTFGPLPNAYLSGSFRNCVFGDLGGEGPPGIDAINCDFRGAKFLGAVKDIQARGCNFRGAKLPANVPFYCHDMVLELLRQGFAKLPPARRTQAQAVYDHILNFFRADRYSTSWVPIIKESREQNLFPQREALVLAREILTTMNQTAIVTMLDRLIEAYENAS